MAHLKTISHGATTPEQVEASRYLLRPKEIWARAYAQFIATTSQDSILMGFLDRRRSPEIPNPIQWLNGDFAPLARATESVFRELGWIS